MPKCASATVRQSLKDLTDIGYPVTHYPQHLTLNQFLDTEFSGLFEMDDYFRFTFVRNPYDRLFSGYMQDRFAATQYPVWQVAKESIFKRIGDDFNRYMTEYVRRANLFDDWEWICFCPMHAFVYLDGECMLDFVGRAESIENGLAVLSERFGLKIAKADDVNVNAPYGAGLKYLSRYDRATIEIVNELYYEDFKLFGYDMLDPKLFPIKSGV